MAGSAELLAFTDRPEHDGHRVRGFARHDQGLGQADQGRDDRGVAGRELAAPVGQHPLIPCTASPAYPAARYAAAN